MSIQNRHLPNFANLPRCIYQFFKRRLGISRRFPGSEIYWERRYSSGRNSGVGSYEKFAKFKAEILNSFVDAHGIKSVIEFGCGDGGQLSLANYPEYIGYDVSQTVIEICTKKFSNDDKKKFKLMREYAGETAELSLSLDVIYHLVEDEIYEHYMRKLFKAGNRYVIIYSSNFEDDDNYSGRHVRHREFTKWINDNEAGWKLIENITNIYPYEGDDRTGSFADFYIFGKTAEKTG